MFRGLGSSCGTVISTSGFTTDVQASDGVVFVDAAAAAAVEAFPVVVVAILILTQK